MEPNPPLSDILGENFQKLLQIREKARSSRNETGIPQIPATIDELGLSRRPTRNLTRAGIDSTHKLLSIEPQKLLNIANFGIKSLLETADRIAEYGFWFGDAIPSQNSGDVSDECALQWVPIADLFLADTHPGSDWLNQLSEIRDAAIALRKEAPSTPVPRMVSDLGLRVRSFNCLRRASISTTECLISASPNDLLRLPNFGINSLIDVASTLSLHGVWFTKTSQHFIFVDKIHQSDHAFGVLRDQTSETKVPLIDTLVQNIRIKRYTKSTQVATDFGIGVKEVEDLLVEYFKVRPGNLNLAIRQEFRRSARYREQVMKEARKDNMKERLDGIIEMRSSGQSLEEIGSRYGLTRQRIQQLIVDAVGNEMAKQIEIRGREAKRIRTRQSIIGFIENGNIVLPLSQEGSSMLDRLLADPGLAFTEHRRKVTAIIEDFIIDNPGLYVAEFEERSGVSKESGSSLTPDLFARFVLRHNSSNYGYSDGQILAALRTAATFDYPLSAKKYNELVAVGEIDAPNSQSVINRFGSWNIACEKAGVEGHQPWSDEYQRRWSERELWTAVESFLLLDGHRASWVEFEGWLRGQDGLPSGARIRQLLGTWTGMKRSVYLSESFRGQLKEQRRLDKHSTQFAPFDHFG